MEMVDQEADFSSVRDPRLRVHITDRSAES